MGIFGPGGMLPPDDASALAAKLRAVCAFVAAVLSDGPTTHDLTIVRDHIQACEACTVLYAEYYLHRTEAIGGAV